MSLPFVKLLIKGLTPGIANHQLALFFPTSLTSRIPLLTRVLQETMQYLFKKFNPDQQTKQAYDMSSWLNLSSLVSFSLDTLTSVHDGRTLRVSRLHRALQSPIHETT